MFEQATRDQYKNQTPCRVPRCNELAGQSFFLRFDDGVDLYLNCLDERFLLLGRPGSPPTLEKYYCMKSDLLTYFVHIDRAKPLYAPITLVLDLENRLVTRADSAKASPAILHWFTIRTCSGYIDEPGYPMPTTRHEISRDLVGSKIEWYYTEFDPITHIYMPNDTVRLGYGPLENLSPDRQEFLLGRKAKGLDLFEEPVRFIKIKTNKYLACFCECNMAHVDPNLGGGGLLLMDLAKMADVGIFHSFDQDNQETYTPIAVFGRFVYHELKEEKMESRYKIRYGLDGEQVYP
jgi:hypothetical protein